MQIEVTLEDKKKVNAKMNGYLIKTDQPQRAGGEGTAPAPFDLFLASIGTCAGIFVKSFCDQRGIPAEKIKIIQDMDYNQETHMIGKISLDIQLPPDFPEKYRDAVINVANLCTVKKHIHNPPEFDIFTTVN